MAFSSSFSPGVSQIVSTVAAISRRAVVAALYGAVLALISSAGVANAATNSAVLARNTFLGGASDDYGHAITVDGTGNTYVAGNSMGGWGAPVLAFSGSSAAFVAKLDAEGTVVWNTFLGGSTRAIDIAVDGDGNVYVSGDSSMSWGNPRRAFTGGTDAFAAKLSSDGALVWNTFLGGSGNDMGVGVAIDSNGDTFVGGSSSSTWGSPAVRYTAGNDAFAARLDSSGALLWHSFVGGAGSDAPFDLAIDSDGNAYVTGLSTVSWGSAPIRAFTSADSFVAKVNGLGTLVWNTFIGGSGFDVAQAVSTDGTDIYLTGNSTATWGTPARPFTTTIGASGVFGGDAFAAKLHTDGALVWNTFLGGSGNESGYSITADGSNSIYVTGTSAATWGDPARAFVGPAPSTDAFAAQLDVNGFLVWNTFLGGSGADEGTGLAVDSNGSVHVAGYSSATWETPVHPFTAGSTRPEAFVATLGAGDDEAPILSVPDHVVVDATASNGAVATWDASAIDANDGPVAVQCSPSSGSFFDAGVTLVSCSATDAAGNVASESFEVSVKDTSAPVIATLSATPNLIGPPNHKMIPVVVTVQASDNVDGSPAARIVRVTSNEPENGTGDGDIAPDWKITGPLTLELRAERAGKGDGRIYTITVEVRDQAGNASEASVQVKVRK
jgi:hypothetical protein